MEVLEISTIFAVSNQAFMKEKKDNNPFEGCAEPIGAVTLHSDDEQLYGIDNWPGMPLVGPADINEANARIDQAEYEIENGEVFDWESVMLEASNIVRQYAATVY